MSFVEQSYQHHFNHLTEVCDQRGQSAMTQTDFRNYEGTADGMRHKRKYEAVRSLLHHPDWTWVTIGDGNYGWDAVRIREMGVRKVLPTDISPSLLELSLRGGMIDEYRVENAERLSFADDEFDIVFCKESFHHFPRPYVALYEMIRVARQAVVLIEPRDWILDRSVNRTAGPRRTIFQFLAWVMEKTHLRTRNCPVADRFLLGDPPHYESSGNYMYSLSSREIEKVALGLNLPAVAFKGLNDCYVADAWKEAASDSSETFRHIEKSIANANRNYERGIGSTTLLMSIIFKNELDLTMRRELTRMEWLIRDLDRNPYAGVKF